VVHLIWAVKTGELHVMSSWVVEKRNLDGSPKSDLAEKRDNLGKFRRGVGFLWMEGRFQR